MILKRTTYNNGYGCSCCGNSWENCSWVTMSRLPNSDSILKQITENRDRINDSHTISEIYEYDGKVLYGYCSSVYRAGEDTYLIFNDERYLFKTSIESRKEEEIDKNKLENWKDKVDRKLNKLKKKLKR